MTPQSPQEMTVEAALTQVAEHLNNGAAPSALHVARQVIEQRPSHAHAHHLAGIAAHQIGDLEAMRKHLEKSLSLDPENASYVVNATEMFRQAKDVDRAIDAGRFGVKMGPDSAIAHANLGLAHYDEGDLVAAKACQTKAIELDANHANALNNLGSIARDEGDLADALDYYERATVAAPAYFEAWTNRASVLIEADRREEAVPILHDVLSKAPRHAEAHRALTNYHLLVPDLDAAERSARTALEITGGDADGLVLLAQILQAKNRADLAQDAAKRAVELAPENHTAHHQFALCLAGLENADSAKEHYAKALALKPGFVPTLLALGHLALEYGDKDKARKFFEAAQASEPDNVAPKIALARVTKVDRADHCLLKALENEMAAADHFPPEKAASLFYALGSIYESMNDPRAFPSFSKGAALKRQTITYSADAYDARIDALIAAMTTDRIADMRSAAIDAPTPIFVVGMPRSGTTLTESVLAAHSEVDGVGELPFLQKLFGAENTDQTEGFLTFSPEQLKTCAEDYVFKLTARGQGASYVCDKMPANFHLTGVIHALMPNAKIIHIKRDARDTCLSMFTRLFERSQFMSYDLGELGRAYRTYERLMQHWRSVLPEGALHEVYYEDLVEDLETEARRMLEHCQLEWEPGVLEFHKSERRVRTASVTQVRQRLYSSSVGKWQRYADELKPLLEALN